MPNWFIPWHSKTYAKDIIANCGKNNSKILIISYLFSVNRLNSFINANLADECYEIQFNQKKYGNSLEVEYFMLQVVKCAFTFFTQV